MADKHNQHRMAETPPASPRVDTADDKEWKEVEISGPPNTWKDNIFVPLGILGGAVALGGVLVMRGRGDGRALSQRVMEARVGVQAAVLLGLVTVGYAFSQHDGTKKREGD